MWLRELMKSSNIKMKNGPQNLLSAVVTAALINLSTRLRKILIFCPKNPMIVCCNMGRSKLKVKNISNYFILIERKIIRSVTISYAAK